MAEAETIKCQWCGQENNPADMRCVSPGCARFDWKKPTELETTEQYHLKSDTEALRSIDASLKTIKSIAIWFLILSALTVAASILYVASRL